MKPMLKAPGSKLLKLKCDVLLSNFPFDLNLRRFIKELKRIMPGVSKVSVAAYRVPVQKGHLVDVRVRTRRPTGSAREAGAQTRSHFSLI
jgi:hypothetical protein